MKKRRFAAFGIAAIILAAAVFGVWRSVNAVHAASTCTATLSWDKTSINPGDSATETWTITGAASAIGSCQDNAGMNSTVNNLGFGPQSYTFKNIQHSITCSVAAIATDGSTCSSGDQTVTVNQPNSGGGGATTTPPPAGNSGERCWFDRPGKTGYGFIDQDPNYTVEVNADICGTVQTGGDKFGFCSGELGWRTATGPSSIAPALDPKQYTAKLNGGSIHNEDVGLANSVTISRAELLQSNTYTLTIYKNSSAVTSCSVSLSASTPGAGGGAGGGNLAVAAVSPGVFPAAGSYSVAAPAGSLTVNFNYAPQIPGIFVPTAGSAVMGPAGQAGDSINTFLGQFRKAVYYVVGHEPGMFGAWDLSDPMHPANPTGQMLSSVNGNGPILNTWPHASHGVGAAVAENSDGEARVLDKDGLVPWYGNSYVCGSDPIYGYPIICHRSFSNTAQGTSAHSLSGGQPSFGQQVEALSGAPLSVFATPDGSFFGYSAGKNGIDVYNLSDLSGSADPPYLKPTGTISWNHPADMVITSIPNRNSQFLFSRTEDKKWHIGELSGASGKMMRQRMPTAIQGDQTYAQYATVNGSPYIFVAEKAVSDFKSTNVNTVNVGNLTVGMYKLNPSDMTFSRKGSITAQSAGLSPYSGAPYFTLFAADGGGYPLLAVPRYKSVLDHTYQGVNYYTSVEQGVDLFSIKDALSAGGETTPSPVLNIPSVTQWPVPVGGIIVSNWPLNGFISSDGKLYVYRNAFYYNGKAWTTNGISNVWVQNGDLNAPATPNYPAWGNPTIRVDEIDTNFLAGGSPPPPAPTPTPTPTPPPAPPVVVPSPSSTDPCVIKYGQYCDQITQLQKMICALNPAADICK